MKYVFAIVLVSVAGVGYVWYLGRPKHEPVRTVDPPRAAPKVEDQHEVPPAPKVEERHEATERRETQETPCNELTEHQKEDVRAYASRCVAERIAGYGFCRIDPKGKTEYFGVAPDGFIFKSVGCFETEASGTHQYTILIGLSKADWKMTLQSFEIDGKTLYDSRRRTDKQAIQGTWKTVSSEMNGVPIVGAKGWQTFSAEEVTFVCANGEQGVGKATYKLDPAKNPKEIVMCLTVKLKDFAPVDTFSKGIYQLDGDALKICWSVGGAEAPKDFTTEIGSGRILTVYRRVKP
jgi:uncharacterized protein (TIGR03067 family)